MLYIVATPIGNLGDITDRAKQVLSDVDLVIAENPSYSKRLFDHLGLANKKFIQFAEHNEQKIIGKIISQLKTTDAALISDAGTPGISDPGFRLVREAIQAGVEVISVPGPNAAVAALSASGLPTDKFLFFGFLPKTEIKLVKELELAEKSRATAVFYESPHRILKTLDWVAKKWPDSKIAVARELTKMHEEFIRGTVGEVLEIFSKKQNIKGELTVLISFK